MRVLLTGIDGFVGSALEESLHRRGHAVAGLSIGPRAGSAPEIFRCNITDEVGVRRVVDDVRPAACVHLAGVAHADVGADAEQRTREVNVKGTVNVAKAAAAAGVQRFVFFSSAKVYGDSTPPEGVDEDAAPCPGDIYGRLKLEAEAELADVAASTGLPVVVVRPVAVFGPGDSRGNYARLARAVKRGFFPLVDRGRARRSIAYSKRVAERVSRLVDGPFVAGRTYAFSDGTFTVRQILEAMRAATGPAVFPPVPLGIAKAATTLADVGWAALAAKPGPTAKMLRRLTESFVVRAHRFDEDCGALSPFDLQAAMQETCAAR